MITNMDNLKKELKYVQEKLITSIQAVSRVSMSESDSETVIDKKLGDIIDSVESACITARNVIDKYRIMKPFSENAKKEKINGYIQDTLTRLLDECDKPLPMFDKAFLAIVEYCDYESREVFDQDNKSWKMIPNAIKGRVVEDDEQFKIDIGLFSKISDTPACHIYVIPETQLVDFIYYLSCDLM